MNWLSNKIKNSRLYKGLRYFRLFNPIKPDSLRSLGEQLKIISAKYDHMDENRFIFRFLKVNCKSKIMFDVGAHLGGTLKPFVDLAWKVIAFEPDQENNKKLKERLGDRSNLTIESIAVSNQIKQKVPFYTSVVSTGISGLSAFHESHMKTANVDVTTLRKYCDENQINEIDYLKIDTEGHDFFVLKGFPWEHIKPIMIICEFEDKKTVPLGYTFYELADYLWEKGYNLIISEWYPIIRYGTKHKWRQFHLYPRKLVDHNGWGNIIALRNDFDLEAFISMLK